MGNDERNDLDRHRNGPVAPDPPEPLPRPIGTLFLTLVYLAILAGMWGAMLLGLVGR